MSPPEFNLPDPDIQIALSDRLRTARAEFLQPALLRTVAELDVTVVDREAHALVPPAGLQTLAGRGLRAEMVFGLPSVLAANPSLLGYYRLVLGFSQKAFYRKGTGFSRFRRMEEACVLGREQGAELPDLCRALNQAAAVLVAGVRNDISAELVDHLSLLTLGPQLRGGWNVGIGVAAIREVFAVIELIIGTRASSVDESAIEFVDSTGREVKVRFRSDPDIEVVSIHRASGKESPLLAIEVKGGTDYSNVHNWLGEAEKSHLKARQRGFTDLWTITNVGALSEGARREAPTTTAFFDLGEVVARGGAAYEQFRDRLLQRLRLPE